MAIQPRLPHNRREFGLYAESLAAEFLARQGLQVLVRNYRCPVGELDLIARDGATVVFVEVRSTASGDALRPAISIDQRKQRRLLRLAEYFLTKNRLLGQPARFDVLLVVDNVPESAELPVEIPSQEIIAPDGKRLRIIHYVNALRFYS